MSPKAVDKEVRRREIALQALPLFAERGFEAASISQVADLVGVKKATIYDYFSSKDELVMAALDAWMEQVTKGVEQQVQGFDNPVEALHAFVQAAFQSMQEPFATQLTLAATQLMLREPSSNRFHFLRELLYRARRGLNEIFLEGISQGVFRKEAARDIDIITVNLLAYLDGIALHSYFVGKGAFSLETQIEFYIDRLLETLLATPDSSQITIPTISEKDEDHVLETSTNSQPE